MSKNFEYNGHEILEALQGADNYNNYIKSFVLKERERLIKQKDEIKILDFGAGLGTFAAMFKEMGIDVDCLEIDPKNCKTLNKQGFNAYQTIEGLSHKYDIIYSFNVLEHIEDDLEVLKNLRKSLDNKGVIIIYVPAFNLLFGNLDIIVDHFRRYRLKDLKLLAQKGTLKIRDIRYVDPVGFFLAFIYNLGNGDGNVSPKSVRFFDRYLFPLSKILEPLFKKTLGKNALVIYEK